MSGFRIPGRLQHLSEDTGRELIELLADHAPEALASAITEIVASMPADTTRRAFDAGTKAAEAELTRLRAALAEIRDLSPEAAPQHMGDDYENGKAWGLRAASSLAAKALGGGT